MTKHSIILAPDRPPIEILDEEWPVVARSFWTPGAVPAAARDRAYVRVRLHADGRYLVYGLREEGGRRVVGGRIVRGYVDVTTAIKDVSALVGIDPLAVFVEMPAVAA